MRNMSFSKTTEQAREQTKIVTRRWGWWFLKAGDRVQQVEKAMGLKRDEIITKIHVIEIVSTRPEMLFEITQEECIQEGFPDFTPDELALLLRSMKPRHYYRKRPDGKINRIEFKYVDWHDRGDNKEPQ